MDTNNAKLNVKAERTIKSISTLIVKLVLDWMVGRNTEVVSLPITPSPSMLCRHRVVFVHDDVEYTVDMFARAVRS